LHVAAPDGREERDEQDDHLQHWCEVLRLASHPRRMTFGPVQVGGA
jgi:hypothetical protein